MKPLIVLITTFGITLLFQHLFGKQIQWQRASRIAMCVMLIFTAIGHFIFTKGMSAMIPAVIPCKTEIVYLTGVLEIIMGLALLQPYYQRQVGWVIILFLVLLLPANIYAAVKELNYQTGELNGPDLTYLWFRIPLQLFFIGWVYCSAILNIQGGYNLFIN